MSKLLLIDDEDGIRKVLSISLKSDGYDVATAASGQQGIDLFQKEFFPIVLTDIKMPGMDGIEVLRRIKEINPEVEVIVITGHGDMESAIQSLHLGASDFLTKPVSDQLLSIALKRAEERLKTKKTLNNYANDLWYMVKEKTEEIKRRYEFEDKLVQRSIDGIVATDKEENIIIFNSAAEEMFGYTVNEAKSDMNAGNFYPEGISQRISDVFAGKDRDASDIFVGDEASITAKSGEAVPVRFSCAMLYEGDKPIGSVGFFQDLRKIKHLEKELIKSERLAAIGQTVAGLAHGVKNILNGLKGGLYIVNTALKKGAADGAAENKIDYSNVSALPLQARFLKQIVDISAERERQQKKLKTGWEMVERNIHKVSELVLDLLSYSKEREPEYEKYNPNIIADEVCDLMESKAKEYDIDLIRDIDREMGEIYLDPKGMHSCLLNLVSNAIDACVFDLDTQKHWHVKVMTRRKNESGVAFEVVDNGCGMDEETQSKIFAEFFSTKGTRGTGLGLLVTQKIIKEHGGTMDVASQPGKGTIFTIRLPGKKV
ncbi:MAG: response regulator [Deltaproteobacteria bacterium]|nr:response regulator [Deltaproteobacteria bacterium]MBW1833517.1 response regulator [Deltaproteobacteria bacterium]MBW2164903.1 response regulator [Deltaproteobacteria bacterium]